MILVLSNAARRDLEQIWWSFGERDPDRADEVVYAIQRAASRLVDFPQIGRLRPELAEGIRSWRTGPYLIFYRVRPKQIQVVRILHGRRDLASEF